MKCGECKNSGKLNKTNAEILLKLESQLKAERDNHNITAILYIYINQHTKKSEEQAQQR